MTKAESEFRKIWYCLKQKQNCLGITPDGDENLFLNQLGNWVEVSGGSGTPSLPLNSVQYNNAGAFGGDSGFTRNPTTFATTISALSAPTTGSLWSITTTSSTGGFNNMGSSIRSTITFNATTSEVRHSTSTTDLRLLINDSLLSLGDTASTFNDTLFTIDDINKIFTFKTADELSVENVAGNAFFRVKTADRRVLFGDIDSVGNSLAFEVDDTTETFTFNNGNIVLSSVGTYLNDAAAALGGVPINGIYRETGTGYLKARVV